MVITWDLRVLYGSRNNQQILALHSIKRLAFMTEVESVYCAVRTESLYITNNRSFVFEKLNNNHVLDFKLSACSECCMPSSG